MKTKTNFSETNRLSNSRQVLTVTRNVFHLCLVLSASLFACTLSAYAQGTAGVAAVEQVASDIKAYIPTVQNLIYAIAGIVALGGAISVYIKMNNEDQDIKKSIMLVVGGCIFLVAAAQALPLFFE